MNKINGSNKGTENKLIATQTILISKYTGYSHRLTSLVDKVHSFSAVTSSRPCGAVSLTAQSL